MPGLAATFAAAPGLTAGIAAAPQAARGAVELITEEAGIVPPAGPALRVVPLVEEGAQVAQGAPVLQLRDAPGVVFCAPMPARVAAIRLAPGRKLAEIVLFHDPGGDRHRHTPPAAADQGSGPAVRALIQAAGLWPSLRRRPFGGMPDAAERPAAIFVMAADTRPMAPDPLQALAGQDEALARGLRALTVLAQGPVYLVTPHGSTVPVPDVDGVQRLTAGPRHPQGLAGFRQHAACPATLDAPVWDLHAEDAAAFGALLDTGLVPRTRLVRVDGPALRESRLVHTQPGADLRGLAQGLARPGAHLVLAGSPLEGRAAHWLGPRDRQVSVLPRDPAPAPPHWFRAALTRSARPTPVIPTAALTQAFGAALPAAALVRALASGDDETAMRLGVLSLLEEDVALADYVLGGAAGLQGLLRGMLDRIAAEYAP